MFPLTDSVKIAVDIFPLTDSPNDIHSVLSSHVETIIMMTKCGSEGEK